MALLLTIAMALLLTIAVMTTLALILNNDPYPDPLTIALVMTRALTLPLLCSESIWSQRVSEPAQGARSRGRGANPWCEI